MKSMLKERILVLSGDDSGVVNTYSGFVNGDSGNSQKVFTIKRNGCSRFCGKSVHDKPEWVFTGGRNMHRCRLRQSGGVAKPRNVLDAFVMFAPII
ncbi:hypothetical protein GZ77_09505 [Endozoicomonas montiporae]|uniref:Uncharacterized protein n=2 Tax=Endozoicomonas montiporae TaxID=1027273 RepID=A0A081N7Y4_9GAMM|nr:hypothetical protein EZMO1_1375 [Endozoicomonas montiporae CL-33]KEQ14557.1 hypothetical protein GZ77_09505 [Endozoicomonas montiporae]